MVGTKRLPLAEVDNAKERRVAAANDGAPIFQEPLGGFIFVCNNDTMGEDFERHLFGLPQKYHDSVKAIKPGMPLFLYNYSTHCLHGVFEASSDGGLNIEPDAWGENRESHKNGRQPLSRFPAQVRVRWREERPPLDEEKFRPVLYHYDGPKFRLQLSHSQAKELLRLFGTSLTEKVDEVQDDSGGEWEKVKTKSKAGRGFRSALPKGSVSPSANGGRRRGMPQNGSSSNGCASISGYNNFMHEAISQGRERENAQRWRSDSDSWSGSSSACTTSSNCGSHEEDRPKKASGENGFVVEIVDAGAMGGAPAVDGLNGASSSKGGVQGASTVIGSKHKVEIRLIDDNSNEVIGLSNSINAGALNSSVRSGFLSYSAALKSGMLAGADIAFGENHVSTPIEVSSNSTVGNRSSPNSYSNVATAVTMSPSSASVNRKGEPSSQEVHVSNQKVGEGVTRGREHGNNLSINHVRACPPGSAEIGKVEVDTNGDHRRAERAQPWGKPVVNKTNIREGSSGQTDTSGGSLKLTVKLAGDSSSVPKKLGKDVLKSVASDVETADLSSGNQRRGNAEAMEQSSKSAETLVTKPAWHSNDNTVQRLMQDPDPAVNSSLVTGGTIGQRVDLEVAEKQERTNTPLLQRHETEAWFPKERSESSQLIPCDGHQSPSSKTSRSTPGAFTRSLIPHGSQSKALSVEAPSFQQTRTVYEPRRHQFDGQKHEKTQEDRHPFRKQQVHAQECLLYPSAMPHTQGQQLGQGLAPIRIPSPHSPGMHHNQHHPLLVSPLPQGSQYRDRSRSRAANGTIDSTHSMAYRPISRNMLDGESALQSPPLGSGSWGLLMQPSVTSYPGSLTFPTPAPHMLVNAEALHSEILEFAQAARPSAKTRVLAEVAVECVRSCVKRLWPEADVEVFGSFATGLCLHHSDVDVVVVDAPPPENIPGNAAFSGARLLTPLIRALSSALENQEWCEGLNTIETASMPVIKLRCNPNSEGAAACSSVAIDITIGGKRSEIFAGVNQVVRKQDSELVDPKFEAARNAHNGAAAREFVIERLRQLPALAPLVLLLKSFLRSRSLNDVYSGGLGSFALTLMLVFFLERVTISCGTPQESAQSSSKSPKDTLSVDMSQASIPTAESFDLSDDDSSDSSVLTSTSASSAASVEVASLHGSSFGGVNASTSADLFSEEPLLRRAGGIVEELLASMHSVASPNLGILLIGFLHYFGLGGIDLPSVRLVLKGKNGNMGGLFWHDQSAGILPLWIDDPLRPDANIGAGSFNIRHVQAAMRDMLNVIMAPYSTGIKPLPDDQRVGKGPGRRRPLNLLEQFLLNDVCY